MKTCPFCAEEIQDKAIKCRWCGEFLNITEKKQQQKQQIQETISKKKDESMPQHKFVIEEANNNRYSPKIEMIQVEVDGKMVEVPRWYKDLSETQKELVVTSVFGIKLWSFTFPYMFIGGRLRARCYLYFILFLIVFFIYFVLISLNLDLNAISDGYLVAIGLLPLLVNAYFVYNNLGMWAYNKSKGYLHKMAYLTVDKINEFNTKNMESSKNSEINYKINGAINNEGIENDTLKNDTTTKKINVIDLYSLNNGSGEIKIVEKEEEQSNNNSKETEENNFPIWVIPVILFFLYFIFQALNFTNTSDSINQKTINEQIIEQAKNKSNNN